MYTCGGSYFNICWSVMMMGCVGVQVFPLLRSFLDLEEGKLSKGNESDTAQDVSSYMSVSYLITIL